MKVPGITGFYPKDTIYTREICKAIQRVGMPEGLEVLMLEPDKVVTSTYDENSFLLGFDNGGYLSTTNKNGPREYVLEGPPTPMFIIFDGQEVFAVPRIDSNTPKVMRASTNKYGVHPIP